jgi:hypothetical protein
MTQQIEQFAEAASQFCAWAEGASSSARSEAIAALGHLSNLYQLALSLPEVFGDEEPAEVTHDAWAHIYERFGSLPFNYYSQCFCPTDSPAEAPVIADLADDLADTWRDLKRGLSLFQSGHINSATWEWRHGFWQHWGRHAAGGIYALHSWLAEQPEVPPNNSFKPKPLRGSA